MSGLRVGLACPGADAASVVRAARLADEWNIDSLWVGDPAGGAANSDDTYVMVAAAAAAATTTHVRLGVFLSARSSSPPLRIAEDIGVVDQISAGRLAVAFSRPPPGDDDGWLADLARIARAPQSWDLGDGRRMPVTPAPAQPSVPMARFDAAPPGASGLRARPVQASPALLAVPWPDPESPPAPGALRALKARCAEAGAGEAILLVPPGDLTGAAAGVVGTVVAPCLRAADHELPILALDATRWLERCGALHHPPGGD